MGNSLYAIMNHLPVGIIFLECPNGKVTYANEHAVDLYGVDPKGLEIVDQATKLVTLLRTNGGPYPVEMLPMSRAMRGIIVTKEELIIERHIDGSRITVSAYAVPLMDEDGKIVGSVGIFQDITGQKQMQMKLQEYSEGLEKLVEEKTKQLKDSERMKAIGETASMVGHDIRNPLQAITSDIYLAKSDLAIVPEGEEKESINSIEKNVEYINKIVQDLQDYARPPQPAAKEIDLQSLFENILLKSAIPESIQASFDIKRDVKLVISDADLLKRVLTNLVNNAVQAMPKGGKLTIRAYLDAQTADIIIAVIDTGCGVPESIRPNLFKPMFTTKSKGQGFGLAAAKRITESMGGTISFESELDKGTTFRIRLPLSQRNKR